jgi:oligopeptide transport system substrate-binding protein
MLISCGYNPYPIDNQNVFRMIIPSGLSSLDPAYARDQSNGWMVSQIFNGLVQLDSQLIVQPCIARSWEIRDSGRVYIFHLRTDVLFHSHPTLKNRVDRRVKAEDVVYSFNRIMDPQVASYGQWIFSGKIENDKASLGKISSNEGENDKASLGKNSLNESKVDKASLEKNSSNRSKMDNASLGKSSLSEGKMDKASLDESSSNESKVDKASLGKNSLNEGKIDKASLEKNSSNRSKMDNASLGKSSLSEGKIDKASLGENSSNKSKNDKASLASKPSKVPLSESSTLEAHSQNPSNDALTTNSFTGLSGLQALNDSTVIIRLNQPFPAFLSLLSMPYASIVPKESVESLGKNFRSNPVGTGPFCFKSWREGESLILIRNPEYFEVENGQTLPYLDAIRVEFSPSPLTTFHKLVRNEIDFMNRPDLSLKDELFNENGDLLEKWTNDFYLIRKPQLNTEYLGIQMDTASFPHSLSSLNLRKAMAFALDRDKIVSSVLKGMGYPAHGGFVPPGMPFSDTSLIQGIRFNPDSAEYYLKVAGFPKGRGLPEIKIYTSPSYQAVMEMVQYQLGEQGIRVTLDNGSGASLREMIYQGKTALWRASWIADYPDPENYLSLFYSPNKAPNGPNTTRYNQAEFDSYFEKFLKPASDSVRTQYCTQLQELIRNDVPVILLYYDRIIRVVRNSIENMETDGMNNLVLKRVKKTIESGNS